MSKHNFWNIIKGEMIYWILIVILSGFFLYLTNTQAPTSTLIFTGVLNIFLLETWFIRTFLLFSGRKISQYSNVIQRISFRERIFEYFLLPILFLSTFMAFLYFNKSVSMGYWVFTLCMFVILVMFINVKSSLRHIYRTSILTKGIFDFLCILAFYLSINILFRLGLGIWINIAISLLLAFLVFLAELKLHNRLSITSGLIALMSSAFVTFSIAGFIFQSIFVITAIGTVAFFLIVSLWNLRFAGKYKMLDYIPPFIYSIITLILIFNL